MGEHRYEGRCHCGNLSYVFETSASLDVLGLRACQCSFCRAHGARTTSDPNGAMRIRVRDKDALQRYRFGLKTADFLLCKTCGVFLGAIMEENGSGWMTVSANTLQPPPVYDMVGAAHEFGAEDTAQRIARRKAKWTPVVEFSA